MKQKEEEANNFAAKYLLPVSFEDELPFKITEEDVESIAKKYEAHPGIVVGRLQHLGLVKYSFGNKYKAKVDLFNNIKNTKPGL